MSHFTKLDKANIVDAASFIAACQELGLTNVKQNVEIKDFYGQTMKVDVAIKCGKFDIALKKNANDTYDMVGDWWGIRGSGLSGKLKGLTEVDIQNMLLQYTTKHTIINRYKKQGYQVQGYKEDEQGDLQYELVKY